MKKFLITGTGRCGTMYCAAILRVCNVRCGHQDVFRHIHTLGVPHDWADYEGATSFEAVPMLPRIRSELEIVVLLIRGKQAVVDSWLRLGAFQDDMETAYIEWYQVLKRYAPSVLDASTPILRAMTYYDAWNNLARPYADEVLPIEKIGANPACLFRSLHLDHRYNAEMASLIPATANTR